MANGSLILWSCRFEDGQYPGGKVCYRVPVRCEMCGEVRVVGAGEAHKSGFTGLCHNCARGFCTEDEELANGSLILWSQRFEAGRTPGGRIRWRVPVRCGECGQVREVGASRAHGPGCTGLCPACAGNEEIHIPEATIERLYHDENLSTHEIGARLGCSHAAVRSRMIEYGIERRPAGGVPQTLVPEEVLRRWSPELAYVAGYPLNKLGGYGSRNLFRCCGNES